MALDFPSNPTDGQTYNDPLSTTVWVYYDLTEAWNRVPVAETTNDPFVHVGTPGSISLSTFPPQAGGTENTIVGLDTGQSLNLAAKNTFVGSKAGAKLNEANYNTLIGAYAGASLDQAAVNSNVIVGAEACMDNTLQDNTVVIGAFASTNTINSSRDEIVIGTNARGNGNGTTVIGDANTLETELKGAVTIGAFDVNTLPSPVDSGRLIIVTGMLTPSGFPALALSVGSKWINTMDGTDIVQ